MAHHADHGLAVQAGLAHADVCHLAYRDAGDVTVANGWAGCVGDASLMEPLLTMGAVPQLK